MYKDSDGRICGSQWGIFAQVILPLPIINCAAQCVLCSHFGIDWNVHEFFAPETLLFSCSNLFSVIDIHSTGSWSKWLLVLGNLRASTLQVRSLNDHLLSSQKTCVFRGLLCVSENFVFRDGNLSSVMNWLNSCRLINNTARTGRFLLKWTNQVILICLILNDTHTLCNHASKDLLCHDNYVVVIILNYFIWQERFMQNQRCQNLWWRFLWKNPWWWTDWLRQVICAA